MGYCQIGPGVAACAALCLLATGCVSTGAGYGYTGGAAIGAPTLVDARSQAKPQDDARRPRLVAQGHLVYPTWPLLQAVCGTVVVAATVGHDGRPRDTRIESQTFNKKYVADENTGKLYPVASFFDQPAIDYVLGSRYAPATVAGVPTDAEVRIPIAFGEHYNGRCRKP